MNLRLNRWLQTDKKYTEMKKKKLSDASTRDIDSNSKMLGINSGSVFQYGGIPALKILYLFQAGVLKCLITTDVKVSSTQNKAVLFRLTLHNRTHDPNFILIQAWIDGLSNVNPFKYSMLRNDASNAVSYSINEGGFLTFMVTLPVNATHAIVENISPMKLDYSLQAI